MALMAKYFESNDRRKKQQQRIAPIPASCKNEQ